jgi:hypothetical protein
MLIPCECGHEIRDGTDNIAEKGHVIPDQEWFATFDAVDRQVIDPLLQGKIEAKRAYMLARLEIGRRQLIAYQCPECGRLYIGKLDGKLHCFLPAGSSTPRNILAVERSEG